MAKHTGKDGLVRAGPTSTIVGHLTDFTINDSIGTTQSRATGQIYVNQYALLRQWNGTINFELDWSDPGQQLVVVGDKLTFELFTEGDAVGKKRLTGSALITNRDVNSPSDGMATLAVQVAGDGQLTEELVT